MAASKCYSARQSHRFLPCNQQKQFHGEVTVGSELELDEWDLYNPGTGRPDSIGFKKVPSSSGQFGKKRSCKREVEPASGDPFGASPSSLPVNVPDWSKILREEHRESRRWCEDVVDEETGDNVEGVGRLVPPHEFLARTRITSFSVHEGAGRTLKGRDLSRVRNAIFEITGFQD